MVVFNEKTCEIIRLYEQKQDTSVGDKKDQKNNLTVVSHAKYKPGNCNTTKWAQDKEIIYGWHYMTVGYNRHYNSQYYYKLILNYMLRMVKTDTFLRCNFVFQIVPVIIKHIEGEYYIVIRIRIGSNIAVNYQNVLNYLMDGFNAMYNTSNDMVMMTETDKTNTEHFHKLYACEFVHKRNLVNTKKSLPLPPMLQSRNILHSNQPMYALSSMTQEPPPPPMPKLLNIGYDVMLQHNYYGTSVFPLTPDLIYTQSKM